MIVACTGHVEEEYIKKAWTHEIDEILPKPIQLTVMQDIFNEIVNNKKVYGHGSVRRIDTNKKSRTSRRSITLPNEIA